MKDWNPELYQASHSFVWEHARDLIALLAPKPGERILDAGCGTGQLTTEIANSGAHVVGIDSSENMIAQARANCPALRFEIADVRDLPFAGEFDAVFSNAALHWVKEAETAVRSIRRALRPGGRFVAEFGGYGNVCALLDAVALAFGRPLEPWFFPTVGEYAAILEANGFLVRYAALFDRPTPLDDPERGLAQWLEMFGQPFFRVIRHSDREQFVREVEQIAESTLRREGRWWMDYVRLRIAASTRD